MTFIDEKNKQTNKPICLYTVFDYDGADNDLNFAAWHEGVEFDGITYTAFPISHDAINENNQGEANVVRVRVANISRLIQSYLEDYDFRGKKVRLRFVFEDELADADAKYDYTLHIDSYTATQEQVEFTLQPKTFVLDFMLPARLYSRNYCKWRFKSTECGYAGGETTCNKTKARCKALDNYDRFGGFPSIPQRRLFIQ